MKGCEVDRHKSFPFSTASPQEPPGVCFHFFLSLRGRREGQRGLRGVVLELGYGQPSCKSSTESQGEQLQALQRWLLGTLTYLVLVPW